MRRGRPPGRLPVGTFSQEERGIVYHGCPISTLAEIFHMKRQTVERRLGECPIAGTGSRGTPLYQIADAAPYLIRVKLTEDQVLKVMQRGDPRDLPPMSNKMFWEGMIQRRKYEEIASDMWHTTDVASVAASAFNTIRMSLLLLPDELTDNAGLNEAQRKIAQDTVDAAMESLQDALITELRKPSENIEEEKASDE